MEHLKVQSVIHIFPRIDLVSKRFPLLFMRLLRTRFFNKPQFIMFKNIFVRVLTIFQTCQFQGRLGEKEENENKRGSNPHHPFFTWNSHQNWDIGYNLSDATVPCTFLGPQNTSIVIGEVHKIRGSVDLKGSKSVKFLVRRALSLEIAHCLL